MTNSFYYGLVYQINIVDIDIAAEKVDNYWEHKHSSSRCIKLPIFRLYSTLEEKDSVDGKKHEPISPGSRKIWSSGASGLRAAT